MSRPRLHAHDKAFWEHVRSLLNGVNAAGHSWTAIAKELRIGKQTLTGFRKRRAPALDAEALLRFCATWKIPLTFQEHTIHCATDETPVESSPGLQFQMEFDESFELLADPNPRAILTRKPPNKVSFIGIRIERVGGKPGPSGA